MTRRRMLQLLWVVVLALGVTACGREPPPPPAPKTSPAPPPPPVTKVSPAPPPAAKVSPAPPPAAKAEPKPDPAKEAPAKDTTTAKATFAGGCFWCMEEAFDTVPGVIATTSGYMGGQVKNPSYEQVTTGRTGHAEVIQVEYDPSIVTYARLLEVFWRNIDPTQRDAQFCDYGSQYRSGIFYHDEEQKRLADASRAALAKNKPFKGEVVTEITKSSQFYPAEGYHQNYYLENPARYKFYKSGCGREARLKQLWG